jgi:uncharacterized SAM-binding protein YcdF (DUF218 family)
MGLFLSKLFPVFAYPIGFVLLLGLIAFCLSLTRFRGLARILLLAALVVLWIASMPVFANWLIAHLEAPYPEVPVETLPQADVAILLGGAVSQPLPPRVTADLGIASDRIVETARLFRAGKVDAILVAAGNLPWLPAVRPEAELLRDLLVEFGVPESAIVIETQSRNTHENAVNATAIFRERGWKSGLLVTSAAHMPRALAAFRRAGLVLTPASTDIQATYPFYNSPLDILPDADALATTTKAMKEWLGLLAYRYRGWA